MTSECEPRTIQERAEALAESFGIGPKFIDAAKRQMVELVNDAIKEAVGVVHKRTEVPECDSATYDASCNAWECSREPRGDCLCADGIEQAEEIEADIRKLLEPSP